MSYGIPTHRPPQTPDAYVRSTSIKSMSYWMLAHLKATTRRSSANRVTLAESSPSNRSQTHTTGCLQIPAATARGVRNIPLSAITTERRLSMYQEGVRVVPCLGWRGATSPLLPIRHTSVSYTHL